MYRFVPYIRFGIKTDRILKYEAVFIKQFPRFKKIPSVLDEIRLAYLIHFVDSKAARNKRKGTLYHFTHL